jgi:hypothetical protein
MVIRVHAGRWLAALLVLAPGLLLVACTHRAVTSPPPAAVPSTTITRPAPGAVRYRILADRSLLTVRVFRGGPLAAMGHNHVVAVRDLQGEISLAPRLEDSTLAARFQVARLTVDEPGLRALAGADFATEVPDAAREGTRRNLLSAALLDAAAFPAVEIVAQRIVPQPGGALLTLQLRLRDRPYVVEVPVVIEHPPGQLVASGELRLRQSELGLVPFSVMMGALQVQDEMQLQFRVAAAAD